MQMTGDAMAGKPETKQYRVLHALECQTFPIDKPSRAESLQSAPTRQIKERDPSGRKRRTSGGKFLLAHSCSALTSIVHTTHPHLDEEPVVRC